VTGLPAELRTDRLHAGTVGDQVGRRAEILEPAADHRHLIQPDRGEHDPHDRIQAEHRALGGRQHGQADRHAIGGDRDDDRNNDGRKIGPVRLPAQHTQQNEDCQQR
jgi:hypothetical protein